MEIAFITLLVIAIVMGVLWGVFEAIKVKNLTGVWDYGYVLAVLTYSALIAVATVYAGLLDITMPMDQWWAVLIAQLALYSGYLAIVHTFFDYLIMMIFKTAPQGLATPFLSKQTKMELAMKR